MWQHHRSIVRWVQVLMAGVRILRVWVQVLVLCIGLESESLKIWTRVHCRTQVLHQWISDDLLQFETTSSERCYEVSSWARFDAGVYTWHVVTCGVCDGSVCVAVTTTRRIVLMTLIGIAHLETRSRSRLTRRRSHLLTTTNRFLCLLTLFAIALW